MKRDYFKMAFVSLFAVVALCSCSKDNDDNNDKAGNSVIQNNTISVSVENGASYSGKIDIVKAEIYSESDNEYVPLVSVPYNSGVFTINLPANVGAQHLSPPFEDEDEMQGLTVSNPNVKGGSVDLDAYKSNSEIGLFYLETGDWEGSLIYVDGNLNITGSHTETGDGWTETLKYNYNLRKGWNIVYVKETSKGNNSYDVEFTTQVPGGEAKWYFHEYNSSNISGSLRKQTPSLLSAKRKFGFIK
jgi:hypothetical protein